MEPQYHKNVNVSKHPILLHKITILRDLTTSSNTFRNVLKELTYHLGYEASSTLSTIHYSQLQPTLETHSDALEREGTSTTAAATTTGTTDNNNNNTTSLNGCTYDYHKLKERVALIPILRSGLGMIDSMMELIPNAEVHHIGMYHKTTTDTHYYNTDGINTNDNNINTMPVLYYNRLPKHCNVDIAYILDPCIATASTMISIISILKKWGKTNTNTTRTPLQIHVICVIASKIGIQTLMEQHPDIYMTIGVIDPYITTDGRLIPGIGDAGDRLFGISSSQSSVSSSSSKRKRVMTEHEENEEQS